MKKKHEEKKILRCCIEKCNNSICFDLTQQMDCLTCGKEPFCKYHLEDHYYDGKKCGG